MPHVSKKQLEKQVFLDIYDSFAFSVSGQSKQKRGILNNILTKTEKIMLAKRFSAVFMLIEGASLYNIQHTLKISPSTAGRFAFNLDRGMYGNIEKSFSSKQKRKNFWDTLETLIRFGMPPMGRGRWKWLYEMDNKYK